MIIRDNFPVLHMNIIHVSIINVKGSVSLSTKKLYPGTNPVMGTPPTLRWLGWIFRKQKLPESVSLNRSSKKRMAECCPLEPPSTLLPLFRTEEIHCLVLPTETSWPLVSLGHRGHNLRLLHKLSLSEPPNHLRDCFEY